MDYVGTIQEVTDLYCSKTVELDQVRTRGGPGEDQVMTRGGPGEEEDRKEPSSSSESSQKIFQEESTQNSVS